MFGKDKFAERNRDNVILGVFGETASQPVSGAVEGVKTNASGNERSQHTQALAKANEASEYRTLALKARSAVKLLNVCDADGGNCRKMRKCGDRPADTHFMRKLASVLRG